MATNRLRRVCEHGGLVAIVMGTGQQFAQPVEIIDVAGGARRLKRKRRLAYGRWLVERAEH